MTLKEVSRQTILFGKVKFGIKVFKDLSWTRFVASRFEHSEKKEHQNVHSVCQAANERQF